MTSLRGDPITASLFTLVPVEFWDLDICMVVRYGRTSSTSVDWGLVLSTKNPIRVVSVSPTQRTPESPQVECGVTQTFYRIFQFLIRVRNTKVHDRDNTKPEWTMYNDEGRTDKEMNPYPTDKIRIGGSGKPSYSEQIKVPEYWPLLKGVPLNTKLRVAID